MSVTIEQVSEQLTKDGYDFAKVIKFIGWYRESPDCWREFQRIALDLIQRGKKAGAIDIMARVRWECEIEGGKDYKALQTRPEVDPTEGMSGMQKYMAGLGKSVVDIGRGVGQITGLVGQEAIDEAKALDAPLMKTGAGIGGNITGNILAAVAPGGLLSRAGNIAKIPGMAAAGQAMLAPPMTLGGAAIGAGMGAAQGAIQPVASDDSRAANIMLPAMGGAAIPLLGMGFGAMKGKTGWV